MRKIINLFLLIISIFLFIWLKYYGELPSYNYQVAYIVEYIFYWSIVIFILSLFASGLSSVKYKVWLLITVPFIIFSIIAANDTDHGDILFSGQYIILWLISLYSFISIIYFIIQFFKNKKHSTLLK